MASGFALSWVDRYTLKQETVNEPILSPEIEALELNEELAELLTIDIDKLLGNNNSLLPLAGNPKGRVKSRYSCPECKLNVWGKPELDLSCNICNKALTESGGE